MLNRVTANKKLQTVKPFNEKLVKRNPFSFLAQYKDGSRLIVYEGEVEVTLKKDNNTVLVPAGKVYFNDF
ncbi:MAG: hypothetical protein IPN29_22150 [Saprospiraceae bacterium]|nr:hypothetical protein [Saprospiraceae bacterium]